MNKIFKYFGSSLMVAMALTACSPESFDGPDQNGIPSVSDVDFDMVVDQEVNQVTYSFAGHKGVYPIWIVNGANYSTLDKGGWANAQAGTYTIELKLGNRNGISQGSVKKDFTFNETKVNYTADLNRIADKDWRIDHKEVAHIACGEVGGDGTGWWSAAADEKKDFGVYDDRITFTSDGKKGGQMTYNPGEDGMTYVNTGTTKWGASDADFDVALGENTVGWHFETGNWTDKAGQVNQVNFVVLDGPSGFPYISSDEQYDHPRFRVETLSAKKMTLIYEAPDGSIAWRYMFTCEAESRDVTVDGFDANSDFNLWKGITPVMSFYYNPDPGWGNDQTALMESLFVGGDNDYTVSMPEQTYAQWQAQVHFHTDIASSSATTYDLSCIISSDQDISGATVKLTSEEDGEAFFFGEQIDLKAGEDYVFWKSDFAGVDFSQVKLVFDFGGAPAETHVNISNIVLKDHANDDGTIVPGGGGEGGDDKPTLDWDNTSGANLWKAVDDGSMFDAFGYYFAAGDDWHGIDFTEATHDGDTYKLTLPAENGANQWQAQFHIDTKLTASAAKKYNFYMVMEADQDCPGVTFKLTDAGDTNWFIEERNDVKADEPFILKREGVMTHEGLDAEAIRLFFDFGGSPAGTNIKISKIYFEEVSSMAYEDENNLWKQVDDGSMFDAFGYYFAAGDDWHGIDYTEATHDGDTYKLTLPAENGANQWQAQFHIDTKLTASAAQSYNFQLVLEADQDCPGVTIKLTDAGDTNWFCEGRHDITADEPYVFTLKGAKTAEGLDADAIRLFFDFGGSPAGTNIKISKIIFEACE